MSNDLKLQYPVLKVIREPSGFLKFELNPKIAYPNRTQPNWLSLLWEQNPCRQHPQYSTPNKRDWEKLHNHRRRVFQLAGECYELDEHIWKLKAREVKIELATYAQILSEVFVNLKISEFLACYAQQCNVEIEKVVPLLAVEMGDDSIMWQWAALPPFDSSEPEKVMQRLWCRLFAIAVSLKVHEWKPPHKAATDLPSMVVITRMMEKSGSAKYPDETSDEVERIKKILAIWECFEPQPVGSTKRASRFAVLVDPVLAPEEISHVSHWCLSTPGVPVVLYHGHHDPQQDDLDGLRLFLLERGQGSVQLPFSLQALGETRKTLVLGACRGTDVICDADPSDEGKPPVSPLLNRKALAASEMGATWIGTPLLISNLSGLRFIRTFLEFACTTGMPISEILRRTINRLSVEHGEDYAWDTFLLAGSSESCLPFVRTKHMNFNWAEPDRLLFERLARRFQTNPSIPVKPNEYHSITAMDDAFLRANGLGPDRQSINEPQVWAIGLAAVGRALIHAFFPQKDKLPMRILGGAFYTRGATRLIVWNRQGPFGSRYPLEDASSPKRVIDRDPSAIFYGLDPDSFGGTLLRIFLARQGVSKEFVNTRWHFEGVGLHARVQAIQTPAASGCLFWGGDFIDLENTASSPPGLESPLEGKPLATFLEESKAANLDNEFFRSWEMATGLGAVEIPMLLFVLTGGDLEKRENQFAVREFLREYSSTVHEIAIPKKDLFRIGPVSYFRSMTDAEIDVISQFISEASALSLWKDADIKLSCHSQKDLIATVRRRIEAHLWNSPAAYQHNLKRLRENYDVDVGEDQLASILEPIWNSNYPNPDFPYVVSEDFLKRLYDVLQVWMIALIEVNEHGVASQEPYCRFMHAKQWTFETYREIFEPGKLDEIKDILGRSHSDHSEVKKRMKELAGCIRGPRSRI